MRRILLLCLVFCHFVFVNAEQPSVPYLTSENDTLSLIDETVDAFNGKLVQIDKDIEIEGAHPLDVLRYYDGGHHFESNIGYGNGLSFPVLLKFYREDFKQNVTIEQREGFEIVCTVAKETSQEQKKGKGKSKKPDYYRGGIDPEFFNYGYTNCCEALLRGEPSLLAMQVEKDNSRFIVTLGDGTKRYYTYFREGGMYESLYRLTKEKLPSGSERHYSYLDEMTLRIKRIWTTNPANTMTVNWINFSYFKTYTRLDASNGQSVNYHQKDKKGKARKWNFPAYSSVKFSQNILKKVTGSHLPTCEYHSLSKSHYINTLFSMDRVNLPDGRFIHVDYDDHERVKKLWTPELLVPFYQFDYHQDHTTVVDAKGGIQRFFYKQRRLIRHDEPHRSYHYAWDDKGQLCNQLLTDSHQIPIAAWEYRYNRLGYVEEAKVTATIKQNGLMDTYAVQYHYSQDGRNQLVLECHPEGYNISYGYVPNTNLLAVKFIWTNDGIQEREFYQYDDGILICTIQDDGSQLRPEDFSHVTYRKVKILLPQLNPALPGLTLPSVILEGYDDAYGNRHFLKRTERIYQTGDLLAEEKIYDAEGKYRYSLKYGYNEKRELISETDSMGHQTIYQYDANGNKIFEEKIGSGRRFLYDYDKSNRLLTEKEQLDIGQTFLTTHAYDLVGNRQQTTDNFGQITKFQHDLASREISATNPLGYTVIKDYDVHGNITRQVDQDGHATNTISNFYGKPLEIHHPDGTTQIFIYNIRGHLICEKARDGLLTHYEVDYRGRVKAAHAQAPDGTRLRTIQRFYKGENLVREIDAMGNEIIYNYDYSGRLINTQQGEKKTFFEYDALGRLTKTISAEKAEIKEYDNLNRIEEDRIEDLSGNVFQKNRYSYDINGNCNSQKKYLDNDHFEETITHYDARNLPFHIIDPHGNQTLIAYYYSDHLRKETLDPLKRKTIEIYDALSRLKEFFVYSPNGLLFAHHALTYDGRGNEKLHTENVLCGGQWLGLFVVEKAYDPMTQKIYEIEQSKKVTLFKYHLGRLQQITNPDGTILVHAYDDLGRLIGLASSDGTISYQYDYDLNDNLLKIEDLIHQTTVTRSYDNYNRLAYEKQTTGLEINFDYDFLDRLKEVRFKDNQISYEYTPLSLLSAKRYHKNQLLYQYEQKTDFQGKVLSCQLPNKAEISYTWDMGRCSNIDSKFYQQEMDYDPVGNLIHLSVSDPQGSYTAFYTYDDANQLTSESGPFTNQYHYDSIHNRRFKNTFANTIDALNQLTQDQTSQYTYDPNGRRLTKDQAIYTYDALGRLTQFTEGQKCINYLYDPFGRLVERSSAESKTQFFYQLDTEIASFENGQMTAFRPLCGIHAPFAIELNGNPYSPIKNHRGDLCVLLEDKPITTYRYNAFGEFNHEGDVYSPWLFSGQRYDADTGLFHYAKREYDPKVGLWLTPDPLGFAEGPNLYAYVNNNPLTYVDPYGLWMEKYENAKRLARDVDDTINRIDDKYRRVEKRYREIMEFGQGFGRGFIDDTTWGASELILGEYKFKTSVGQQGYNWGRGCSICGGLFYGNTEAKAVVALCKSSVKASKIIVKGNNAFRAAEKTKQVFKNTSQSTLKSQVAKEGMNETVNRSASLAGSRHSPLDYAPYQKVRNCPNIINGREYSGHALDRMQDRGLFPSLIENSITNGKKSLDKIPGRIQHYDSANKIRVITEESSGKVITIIPGRG